MGMIGATIGNCAPRGKGAKTLQPTDFYVSPNAARDEGLTPEQLAFIKRKKEKPKR